MSIPFIEVLATAELIDGIWVVANYLEGGLDLDGSVSASEVCLLVLDEDVLGACAREQTAVIDDRP